MNSPDTRPVVVGVDGAPGSAGALRYGLAQARRRGVPLRLVHVVPSPPAMGRAVPVGVAELRSIGTSIIERAAATARELAPEVETSAELVHGPRSDGIVAASAEAQLVVVGRETRRAVLTGATTAGVAARAACATVVVPSFWSDQSARGRVVAGVKTHDHAAELVSRALSEAAARSATLSLVLAWELPDPYLDRIELRSHQADWEADGRELIEELLAEQREANPDVPVEVRVEHGRAADVLLHASRESDLLLVSRHRHRVGPFDRLGGVAHALLRLSDVPVEVVPCDDAGARAPELDLVLEEAGAPVK